MSYKIAMNLIMFIYWTCMRSYHARIIKDSTDPMCRICNIYEETIDHIVSGCSELAKTEYITKT